MTNKEAAKVLISRLYYTRTKGLAVREDYADEFLDAICVALSVLLKQEEKAECKCKANKENQFWHDAKTDPPKISGNYYAKNRKESCTKVLCWYERQTDKWSIDGHIPVEISVWAEYADFCSNT